MVKKDKPFDKSVYRSLAMITQIGISMLVPMCLMSLLGYYLDARLETNFWMILLFFVGALAGGRNVYRLVLGVERQEAPVEDEVTSHGGSVEQLAEPADTQQESSRSARNVVSPGKETFVNKPKKPSGWK